MIFCIFEAHDLTNQRIIPNLFLFKTSIVNALIKITIMKNLFTSFLSLCILLFPLFAFSQLPFSDGFESGSMQNWMASGDTLVINTDPYEGASCFQGNNSYQFYKTFEPITDDQIIVDFAMKAAQDNKESVDFLVYDGNDDAIARIYFANMGYIYTKNGVNDVALKVYTWDVWYQIKLIINQTTATYDIVIDGDTLQQNMDFVTSGVGNATKFYWSGSESAGSIGYVDDVNISVENSGGQSQGVWLQYDDGYNQGSLGGASTFTYAVKWDPDQLVNYVNSKITKVRYFPSGSNSEFTFRIWEGDNAASLIYEQAVSSYQANQWNEIVLDQEVSFDHTKQIWVGFYVETTEYPAGYGTYSGDPNSNYISLDGSTWTHISDYGYENSWNLGAFLTTEVSSNDPEKDALMALYNATDGDNWTDNTNWNSEEPIGNWYGVTTDGDGHVTELALDNNNLAGSIPSEIGDMQWLTNIDISNNNISESIPEEFYSLTNMLYINMYENNLSGDISSNISQMSNLQVFNIFNNNITDVFPVELLGLTDLFVLDFGGNNISGNIPENIGVLSNLQYLNIWGNQLTGGIPESLTTLTSLINMSFSSNQIEGPLPANFGALTNLQVFYCDGNNLSGEIPSSFQYLNNLTKLGLSSNNFEGEFPDIFNSMYNLEELNLGSNHFSGTIPASISSAYNLNLLNVESNDFDSIPLGLNYLSLNSSYFANNLFTFEELENLPPGSEYNPQQTIYIFDTNYLDPGVEGLIQLSFDGQVSGSEYHWYREGEYMSTTNGNSIIATESNEGTFIFSLEITNQVYPEFTLYVDSVIVIVGDGESGGNIMEFNFDQHTAGEYLTVVDNSWSTWSGQTGPPEDALITNEMASSTPNSVKVDGTTDVYLPFNNQTSGRYQIDFDVYIPSGNVGYFNLEHTTTPGASFSIDCFFNTDGAGQIRTNNNWFDFYFDHDSWNTIYIIIDLDNDWAQLILNSVLVHEWQWSKTTEG